MKLGRGIFNIGFLFVGLLLLLWRRLFSVVNSTPWLAERVVILGEGPLAESLLHEIESRPELGICVKSHAQMLGNGNNPGNRKHDEMPTTLSQTSSWEDLEADHHARGIDRIVVAMEERRG